MTVKGKYCSNVMKKHFNKGLVINKEGNENFNTSTKFGSVTMITSTMLLK